MLPVSLPNTSYALSAYCVIASAEASSNLAHHDGVQFGPHVPLPANVLARSPGEVYAHLRTAGFGAEVKRRILLGTYALTAEYATHALFFPRDMTYRMTSLAARLTTTFFASPAPTPVHSRPLYARLSRAQPACMFSGSESSWRPRPFALVGYSRTAPHLDEQSGLDAYTQDVLTVPASLAGLPAQSVPIAVGEGGDGWPLDVSIVRKWGCEATTLVVGAVIEALNESTGTVVMSPV